MMGWIGDKYGRKKALEVSIFLMAIPTFALGCLPTYDRVGGVATVLLIVVRLMQGLSVGGQLMSSLVFTIESKPKAHWGWYGSFVMASANFGALIGGVFAYFLRSVLSAEQLLAWGWRIPFLLGVIVSFCGLYLKYAVAEEDHLGGQDAPPNPLKAAFTTGNRCALLSAVLVPMLWAGGFYLSFVWMAVYMNTLLVPPVPHAFGVNSTALFLSVCLFFPMGGLLSDKYGRRVIMGVGGVCMGILSPLMVMAIGRGNPWLAILAQCVMGISLSLWGSPMMAWLAESFSNKARLTSVGFAYNMAQCLAGGFTPAIATSMVDKVGKNSPGFILTLLSVVSLFGLFVVAPPPPMIEEAASSDAPHVVDEQPLPSEVGELS
jgi:MFS transporter, MHS family, proline/betaine transporter